MKAHKMRKLLLEVYFMGLLLGIVLVLAGCFLAVLLWSCAVLASKTDRQMENWWNN